MINKLLKNLKKLDKKAGLANTNAGNSYPQPHVHGNCKGFHAKQNSEKGAERQRSMGNRNTKPSR